jgi:AcrR family transcriptional regulator
VALRRSRGRPPAASVEQARAVLLRTALEAFLQKGYAGASINDIARRSGISRDTLYRQYGLKEELFRAATGYGLGLLSEHLRMAVASRGSVEDVLLRAALEINSDMSSPDAVPILRLIIAEAHRFPDVAARMFEDSRKSLAPLVDYLEGQRSAGVLAFHDAFEAAFMLSTLAFGGVRIFLQHWPQSAGERQRWTHHVVTYLLRGWQAERPERRGPPP